MMPELSRRAFLGSLSAAGAALTLTDCASNPPIVQVPQSDALPEVLARDEAHWRKIAGAYHVTDRIVNLEGGYFLPMAIPVVEEFQRQIQRVNLENSFYARGAYLADLEAARSRVAETLGVGADEIAFTRGATEAMQCLIGGYNRLKPNDAVMYADLDYPGMQYAMNWLADRRGVRVKRISIPEPPTYANVIEAYTAALKANPDVRLLLLTHVSNKTGLVLPIAEIITEARGVGVDVVVDAAHAWGQIDVKANQLGADFVGFNLHKWIGAPVGAGVLYVKKERLEDIDRMMADEDSSPTSVLSRVHTGTAHFATFLTVPAALDFHLAVGPAFKAARVKYLRDRWVSAIRGLTSVDVLVPDDMSAAITSFRIRNRTSEAQTQRIVDDLRNHYRIFTVRRTGIAGGDCVRVTPALYNLSADVDHLVDALAQIAA